MNRLFSNDSLLGRLFGALGDIIIVNLFFVITSLPVVTLGASLSAMNYAFLKRRRGSVEPINRLYRTGFRDNLRQATAAWLLFAAGGIVLVADIHAFAPSGILPNPTMRIIALALLLILWFVFVWCFAVISAFSNSLPMLLRQSFALAAAHPLGTLLMAFVPLAAIAFLASNVTALLFGGSLLLLFGCGAIGYLYSFLYLRLFRPYLPALFDADAVTPPDSDTHSD